MGTPALAQLTTERGRAVLTGTPDRDEVIEACTGTLRPHALRLGRSDTPLATRLAHLRLQDISVNVLHYGTEVTVGSGDAPLDDYLLTLPLAGSGEFRYGSEVAVGTPEQGVLVGPHREFEFAFDTAFDQVIVRLDRARVEAVAAALTGEVGPVDFDLALAADVRSLDGLLESAAGLVDSPACASRPQLLWQVEQLVIETLLLAQPNNRTSLEADTAASPRLRQAMDYMIEHLADPVTVAEVAAECGMSVRTLQAAFRRDVGASPLQWLRAQRLERAHALLASGAPGLSVTDVAYRCGFFHLGEFGAAFRARYGSTPSAVLAARR